MTVQNKNKKKRKVSLNTLGIVLLIIIAAVDFYIWQANKASEIQIENLQYNIPLVQEQTGRIEAPADDLESRLEAVEEELNSVQADFRYAVDRNQVIDYLLKVAGECSVQILPLVSGGWASQDMGQSYDVLTIGLSADGKLEDVKTFMTRIQNGKYPTLAIPDCTFIRYGTGMPAAGDEIYVSVSMRIGIYTLAAAPEQDSVS